MNSISINLTVLVLCIILSCFSVGVLLIRLIILKYANIIKVKDLRIKVKDLRIKKLKDFLKEKETTILHLQSKHPVNKISYDDSISGLTATNVQDAIEELIECGKLLTWYDNFVYYSEKEDSIYLGSDLEKVNFDTFEDTFEFHNTLVHIGEL